MINKKKRKCVSSRATDEKKETASTTIKMKLNTLFKKHREDELLSPVSLSLLNIIDCTCENMSRIQFLASDLANFHLLRLLNQGLQLPKLNQTFFGRCCIIVTDTWRKNQDVELKNSFLLFRALYPNYLGLETPILANL